MTSILQLTDLHLEFNTKLVDFSQVIDKKYADIVVLTGDIAGSFYAEDFIKHLLDLKYKVIYILGNHEFYGFTINEIISGWQEIAKKYDNFYFLNNSSVVVDGIDFFGTTLWTDLGGRDWFSQSYTNDFEAIKNFDIKMWKFLHNEAIYELNKWLENSNSDKKVVLSHYLPSFKSIHERYLNMMEANLFFATELGNLIAYSDIKLWFHGHTHESFDYFIFDKNIICNPYGYHDINMVNKNFSWNKVIKHL